MNFGGKIKKQIAVLMEEIQDTYLLEKSGTEWFMFNTFPDEKSVNHDYETGIVIAGDRERILRKIAELGALELKSLAQNARSRLPETSFQVRLEKEKFSKLYENLTEEASFDTTSHKGALLYLDSEGNFWLEPKNKLCYSFDKDSERLKILSYLVDNQGYQLIDDIADHVGGKNKQNVRSEIGKIRTNIKKFLQLDDVIQSKPSSGYRINVAYRVVKVSS